MIGDDLLLGPRIRARLSTHIVSSRGYIAPPHPHVSKALRYEKVKMQSPVAAGLEALVRPHMRRCHKPLTAIVIYLSWNEPYRATPLLPPCGRATLDARHQKSSIDTVSHTCSQRLDDKRASLRYYLLVSASFISGIVIPNGKTTYHVKY